MKDNDYNRNGRNNSYNGNKGGDTSRDSSSHYSNDDNYHSSEGYPSDAVQAIPLEVKVYGNNFDRALKAFRAVVQKERVLSSYKEKQTYEKPSDKKRRKRQESKRKAFEDELRNSSDSHRKPRENSKERTR